MHLSDISSFFPDHHKPFLVTGPCSAESEEQLLTIASELPKEKVSLFRAGIWKPRTRPGTFEGMGVDALKWLQTVRQEVGFRVTCEVANAEHVEACLKHEIDVLWIGARSTVNPFTVQEIADALRGTQIPVMIKNPVNPDVNLWMGAIERIHAAGIEQIVAIHRGFPGFEKTRYRNEPMWEIPIELNRLLPDSPLLCDPSHICGNRSGLQAVAQKAMDLNFDGLMIETHHEPDKALSDKHQQITPSALAELLNDLILRQTSTDNELFNLTLEELRDQIDKKDNRLLKLFKERMDLVEKIGAYKFDNNITILQPERWNDIITTRIDWAEQIELMPDFILQIFQQIHQESIRKQTEVMNSKSERVES